jgi:CRISPR-associated protein Csb1
MAKTTDITADRLVEGCGDTALDAGIKWVAELEPLAGAGTPVKPAVYEGGRYQLDRRWESPDAETATPVVVIDNVPSQANRLEAAILATRAETGVPDMRLDLSSIGDLPAHLPTVVSSWQFPHRNADAYLRDAQLDGADFLTTELGISLFNATPWSAGPLVAWFPQALLFGFWQSHLGKKRANTKHARAWVSEIIGWNPASTETKVLGLKGDALNLSVDETVTSNPDDRLLWEIGKANQKSEGAKTDRLSELGHGQVPFMRESDAAPAGVSFARITQTATVSFAQLRRVSLGTGDARADAAARALLVALGIVGHAFAFGRGFALRSGADLRPSSSQAVWLGGGGDHDVTSLDPDAAQRLFSATVEIAQQAGVPLDGWTADAVVLTPRKNLAAAIRATWPLGS